MRLARSFRTRRPAPRDDAWKIRLALETLENRTLPDAGTLSGLLTVVQPHHVPSGDLVPVSLSNQGPPPPTSPNVLVNNPAEDGTSHEDTQSETAIVVAGNNVLVGFNDSTLAVNNPVRYTGLSRSTNGGSSFQDLGGLAAVNGGDAGDPVLARDNVTGRTYLATLNFNAGNNLNIFRSDDNFQTYLPTTFVSGGFLDKEWMAVDNASGSGQGNVYVAVRDFGSGNGIFFFKSTDHGATFGPSGGVAIVSAGSGNVQGAWVTVGPDHAVYVFYYQCDDGSGHNGRIMMRKSTDQGLSFANPVMVTTLQTVGVNGDLGLGRFRSNAFPQAGVNPANANDVYVVYDDKSGTTRSNVYFRESTDGGSTWGTAIKVNDDTTTHDHWQPSLAITPDGSHLGVFWYDRRLDPNNNLIDRFGVVAAISGPTVSFGANQRISDTSFPVVVGQDPFINSLYMGDYDMAAADNTSFYVPWGDNRDLAAWSSSAHNANVRFAKVPVVPSTSASHYNITAPSTTLIRQPFSVTVTAANDNGNSDPNYRGTITFTSSDAAAGLPADYTFTAADAGVHTFDGVVLHSLGSQTITGTDTQTSSITGAASVSVTAPLLFQSAGNVAVGGNPSSVAVGDFNGDGIPDLAVGYQHSDHITILLGNGDGTFQLAANVPTGGSSPYAISTGDLNGDGILDLVVADESSNGTVSVLLGNGDGTFQPAVSYPTGGLPDSVALADLTGSGILDIVSANNQSGTVSVLLGNGDGSFQPAAFYAVGSGPTEVAVGDYNGDGVPDLAVVNQGSNNVSILLGNGDGTFQAAGTVAVGQAPQSVFTADLNGDGVLDLVTANRNSGSVSVLLGNGDGTFQPAVNFATGSSPMEVAVADFDGDGNLDIVTANAGSNNVTVLLGNGDGTFYAPQPYATGAGSFFVAVADWNGDGAPDLAVVNNLASSVSILINIANGPTGRPRTSLPGKPSLQAELIQGSQSDPHPSDTPVVSTTHRRAADAPHPFAVDQYLGTALASDGRATALHARWLLNQAMEADWLDPFHLEELWDL